MQSYRLFKLVQVLKPEELGDVQRFLGSPYFNTNERCTRLFQQICSYLPDLDSPKLTKERLFAKVFDKAAYDDGKMRKTMTYLTQLIERYLAQRMLEKSEDVRAHLLIRSLGERSNYGLFKDSAERRLAELESRPERGKDYFREQHLLNELLYFHPETERLIRTNEYLHRAVEGLEKHFTLLSLQNASSIALRNRVVKPEVKMRYSDVLMGIAEQDAFWEENGIQLFHSIVRLLQGEEFDDLDRLKEMVFAALRHLSRYEQSIGINSLRNYAIPKLNAGSLPHAKLVLELYKYEIQNGLLVMEDKVLNAATFMNIVAIALIVGEIEWAEHFMEEFCGFVPEADRRIALDLSSGQLFLEKGLGSRRVEDFYEALRFFNLVPNRAGLKYDLRVRPAILRTHFEIFAQKRESIEELMQQARNFERHLSHSELYTDSTKEPHFNFLRYCRALSRHYNMASKKQESIRKLLSQIEAEKTLVNKRWLLLKGRELLNKE